MNEWMRRAQCARKRRDGRPVYDAELWQPIGTTGSSVPQIEEAKALCGLCPVRSECLEYALEMPVDSGILGGLTDIERASLKRRRSRARAKTEEAPQPQRQTPPPTTPAPRRVDAAPARMLLADSGLSYSEIAKRTGLDRDSLSKIGRGERGSIYETTWDAIRTALAAVTT
jgi:WhiB family redox-sensing transcriptional regulator